MEGPHIVVYTAPGHLGLLQPVLMRLKEGCDRFHGLCNSLLRVVTPADKRDAAVKIVNSGLQLADSIPDFKGPK